MTTSEIDLQQLALERPGPGTEARRHPRPWFSRVVLPALILFGFAALVLIGIGERLLPRTPVTVVPVVVGRASAAMQREGTPLFQAAGWIEPRPTPITVPALTAGVVKELLVVEGQEVEAGTAVARLIDVDARLALRQAETSRDLRTAELQSARAGLQAAELRLKHPVHLQSALAESQAQLAEIERAVARLPYDIEAAKARVDFAQHNLEVKRAAQDAIARRLVNEAESQSRAAQAELEELQQRQPLLQREADALSRKSEALTAQLQLLISERQQREEADAACKAAEARLAEAELAVEKAQLELDRTTVLAPTSGRVMSLVAHPGNRVAGLDSSGGQSASSVATMYDPTKLQVRADVRLEDVPLVQTGQQVQIATASAKEPIHGTVLLPTSSANIQKNTLEVKIALDNPPATVRPEMLVTATFLAPRLADTPTETETSQNRVLIPRELVITGDRGTFVWIVDAKQRARLQSIEIGTRSAGPLVEVLDGIQTTDKLIASGRDDLQPGARVSITGEDLQIGFSEGP